MCDASVLCLYVAWHIYDAFNSLCDTIINMYNIHTVGIDYFFLLYHNSGN
jgi:hypothetical protein